MKYCLPEVIGQEVQITILTEDDMKKIPRRFQEFERLMREINWNVTLKGREILKNFNSSSSQLQCLSTLYFAKEDDGQGEFTMGELANGCDMSFSATTGIVDRLVKEGLISRERSTRDRRKVIIQLTEKGNDLIQEIINKRQEYLMDLCKNFNKESIDELIDTLETLSKIMKEE